MADQRSLPGNVKGDGGFEVSHRMVLGLALPMTIGFLTTPLLGITDTAVAGRLGDPAILAGLAIGSVIFDLVFATFNFLRASTTALTAQAWGRGEAAEQEAVFFRAMTIALAAGFLLVLMSPMLLAAGLWVMAPGEAAGAAMAEWFRLRMIAGPATLANYAILGFLLGRGQARMGLLLQAIINGTNILLCILFGLAMGYGVSGIALATVTGEIVGMLFGMAYVLASFRQRNPLRIAGLFDRAKLMALFSLNTDIMIRSFALIAAFAVMTRIGSTFGPVVLAANAVLMNFFMVAGFWLDGFANAAETIIGRALGAGHRLAFDRGVRLTAFWSFVLAAFTSLAIWTLGSPMIDFLTSEPGVRDIAKAHLWAAALTALSGALAFHMDGVFIGATWSNVMRNRMVASLLCFLLALWVLVPAYGNMGLWMAFNLFLLARGLFLAQALPGLSRQAFSPAQ